MKNKLDELNITDEGKRKARFHQWLTDEGRTVLIHQIGRVQGLMEDFVDVIGLALGKEVLVCFKPK